MTASGTVEIVNMRGLHARASAAFAREAARYRSRIVVFHEGLEANGASIMELLTLGASVGCTIRITAEGEDAQQAVEHLSAFVAARFGEEA